MPALLVAFGTSFLVGLSGAVSPGPLLAFDIRESMRKGFWAGPALSLGHSLLELAVVLALVLGLGRFFQGSDARAFIGVAGGLFLLWMAYGMFRHPARGMPDLSRQALAQRSGGLRSPLLGGTLVSLSNPFWFVWWMTVGAGLLFRYYPDPLGPAGVAAFYVGHILADFAWFSGVSFGVASGRRWLKRPLYVGIILACGAFLAAMGGLFIVSGAVALI